MIIIADVGSNFLASKELAKVCIKICKDIGVDIVKFQCWKVEELFHKDHPAYKDFRDKIVGLPLEWHKELKEYADNLGIEFMTTPISPSHVDLLEDIGVKRYKIASGDITFYPLLERVGETGKEVILSTGASTLEEVKKAVSILENSGAGKVVVMHCVSLYPPNDNEMNILAIKTLKENFPFVGFSDHSLENLPSVMALALGAEYFEKHITLSRSLKTPDAPFALTPDEFKDFVETMKKAEIMLGSGEKTPTEREKKIRGLSRRGIYLKKDVPGGSPLKMEDLVFLRPEGSTPSHQLHKILGLTLKKGLKKGEQPDREVF